ncbi:MAG TPA: protein-L-isoaspartate(D-aspartate) O-methyltransferase [Pelagibacterium sp.]|uniref:protein-L-isoaspartate(D-aspartate) O-methyltransferase n=1 Tax=Pelagibacterium sp. TaxID=1967288 RepID=UPI002CF662ED|nr:protein-L-isoaspartate(D-aspartate) O-methyltransferase [Pelagibacterium sp.]HWJ86643.1 protein-L-isoaspartate(D-aspartate) O-methyltransferase [Pelagibacterium sp.]
MSEGGPGATDYWEARAGLILNLRQQGITDPRILLAFETVPHELFIPDEYLAYAYRESSLPIGCGQSITAPAIVAQLLAPLAPHGVNKVLEIGTGSGYSAALLARMARRVFTVEKYRSLAAQAQARWQGAGITNIIGLTDDGLNGLEQQAPFERILLTGSVSEVPEELIDQLADGGIAVMAVGAPADKQSIIRIERVEDSFLETELGLVRLSPLSPGRSRTL